MCFKSLSLILYLKDVKWNKWVPGGLLQYSHFVRHTFTSLRMLLTFLPSSVYLQFLISFLFLQLIWTLLLFPMSAFTLDVYLFTLKWNLVCKTGMKYLFWRIRVLLSHIKTVHVCMHIVLQPLRCRQAWIFICWGHVSCRIDFPQGRCIYACSRSASRKQGAPRGFSSPSY